jgi:hypothetical protein
MDLSVSSLISETPLPPDRGLSPIPAAIPTSSTRKGRQWFLSNKDKLRKYARNPTRQASLSPSRLFVSRPAIPAASVQEISDSRFLLASLSEQAEILVSLVASVSSAPGNFFSDSLALALQRQADVFVHTVRQTSEKIARSEIFRSEIVRKNLDLEKSALRDLKKIQKNPDISDFPPEPHDELKAWMEDIRSEISSLKLRLPSPVLDSRSPDKSFSPPREASGSFDIDLEDLQRAREKLERHLNNNFNSP